MNRNDAEERAARLAAQLRVNLKRRKARTRGLEDGPPQTAGDPRPAE